MANPNAVTGLVALVKTVKPGTIDSSFTSMLGGHTKYDIHTPYIDVEFRLSIKDRDAGFNLERIRIIDRHVSFPTEVGGQMDLKRYVEVSYPTLEKDAILVITYPSDRVKGQMEMPETALKAARSADIYWGFDARVVLRRSWEHDDDILEILDTLETKGMSVVKAKYFD